MQCIEHCHFSISIFVNLSFRNLLYDRYVWTRLLDLRRQCDRYFGLFKTTGANHSCWRAGFLHCGRFAIYIVVYIHRVYKWYIRHVYSIYGGPPDKIKSQKWRQPTTMVRTTAPPLHIYRLLKKKRCVAWTNVDNEERMHMALACSVHSFCCSLFPFRFPWLPSFAFVSESLPSANMI